MLKIKIPNNNIPEREYTIKTLLFDFLGLSAIIVTESKYIHYSISFEDKELLFLDSFFNKYPTALSYLNPDAIPKKIIFTKNEFIVENKIPVIYGNDELVISENKIFCGIDIFASSFFMLTRWEEHINKTRDFHNRFPGSDSIAFRNNFLNRPVVNEYVEMLWNMIQKLGYKGERRRGNFELVLTHDIDELNYPGSYRTILGDVLKRGNLKLAQEHFKYIYLSNPYDTFDFLMTTSEKLGVKSCFYFMSTDSQLLYERNFYLKSRLFVSTIKKIKERGHIIGFHPGYYTYDNFVRWSYEKRLLEKAVNHEIDEGRQHYLRMDITKTFTIWDKNNMKIDSTLSFADKEGFRCGTGDTFHIFDFCNRKQLNLEERPLIIMDRSLQQYQKYTYDQALEIFQHYISAGKKYRTKITLLFHNSSFFGKWAGYDSLYKNLLSIC